MKALRSALLEVRLLRTGRAPPGSPPGCLISSRFHDFPDFSKVPETNLALTAEESQQLNTTVNDLSFVFVARVM